ncbi:MAG TPA: isochorismatase family cysteine hydrolase [Rhodanobacteraceae bacterium]|jgi:nicotinamidase-related amidase|nr:isochorismatase family cysteine hydrolase [Rhodanobacteraceae bacterium]
MPEPRSALLIVDMINAFDFAGASALLRETRRIVPHIIELRTRAHRANRPVIYCNDNFGEWRSDFKALIARCTAKRRPARDLVRAIAPEDSDYFILKPKHSAFYETALESLLESLGVRRLVLCGIAGEGCIHATATDAHMREYRVAVARDATASQTPARNRTALSHLENARYATLCAARNVRF